MSDKQYFMICALLAVIASHTSDNKIVSIVWIFTAIAGFILSCRSSK